MGKRKKVIERCLIVVLLLASLMAVIKFEIINVPLAIFIWSMISLYFGNIWIFEKNKDNYFLILPIVLIFIQMLLIDLSLVSWIFGIEIFHGAWAMLSGWPSLLSLLTTFFYIIFLVDDNLKDRIKNWFLFKKSYPKGGVLYGRDNYQ